MSEIELKCSMLSPVPGEIIAVELVWDTQKTPTNIELSLQRRIDGAKSQQSFSAELKKFKPRSKTGKAQTELKIPEDAAYSYDGKIVSIGWLLVAHAEIDWGRDPKCELAIIVGGMGKSLTARDYENSPVRHIS